MGLFDGFRKRVIQADDDVGITAEEGSEEAEEALQMRETFEASRSITGVQAEDADNHDKEPTEKTLTPKEGEWDDFDDELEDPFQKPTTSKERKRAIREKTAKEAESKKPKTNTKDPMASTTGRRLVRSQKKQFEVKLGEDSRSRGGRVIKGGKALDAILNELEDELLSSDMGHSAASDLMKTLRTHLIGARVNRKANLEEVVEKALRGALLSLLRAGYWDFDRTIGALVSEDAPVVVMMVGVNGTGKTTTSAKIAKRLNDQGYRVVVAAADTFRAGAIDQLAAHAERIGIRCVKSQRGGDSAAVARDAIESARAKGDDVVIIDTSGRMQNKSNLMEELRKVHRVTSPHLVIFVADALAGNDAVSQAEEFQRKLSFDGAALCKLDTDAKGGAALSISHATGRPIVLAGNGQGYDDLVPFDPEVLVDDLIS
ncbi:MAG: signal recognition particle-docking protein FtsY [Euryarchaeota archaeon]|nr:signal recognition particle-docking protein FtsY [Euryarchaeota archaeon]|tara:strand:+ start:100 stop:1389 length:1290 start_codon:yes stop_codon:yes gene_type:complete